MGLEHLKWSNASDPGAQRHAAVHAHVPRADGLHAGRDAQRHAGAASRSVFKQPMSLGTRCHQLAMYVVYESPLQMLADSPTNYLREPEAMEFLGPVPDGVGRDARPRRAHRRLRRGRAPQGPRLVRRRDDRLDAARAGRRPVVPRRRAGPRLDHGRFRRRRGRRQGRQPLRAIQPGRHRATRLKIKLAPGGGWAARISAAKTGPPRANPAASTNDRAPASRQRVRGPAAALTAAPSADCSSRRPPRRRRRSRRPRPPRRPRRRQPPPPPSRRRSIRRRTRRGDWSPGAPPVPPPAVSTVPIARRDLLHRRREARFAHRRHQSPFAPNALTDCVDANAGIARSLTRWPPAVQEWPMTAPRSGVGCRRRSCHCHHVRRHRAR